MSSKLIWAGGTTPTATSSRKGRRVIINCTVARAKYLLDKMPWWNDENKDIDAESMLLAKYIMLPGDENEHPDPDLLAPVFPTTATEKYAQNPHEVARLFGLLSKKYAKALEFQVSLVAMAYPLPGDPAPSMTAWKHNFTLYQLRTNRLIRLAYDLVYEMAEILQVEYWEVRKYPQGLQWVLGLLQRQSWYKKRLLPQYRHFGEDPQDNGGGGGELATGHDKPDAF
jgi:hypothetical protein